MRVKSLEELGLSLYAVREDGLVFHTGNLSWVKPQRDKQGYYRVTLLNDEGVTKKYQLHRLVAWAFCEGYSPGLIVNHLDSVPANNHYTNLEWTTHAGNSRHMVDTGRFKYPNKKLSDEDVVYIRHSNIKTKQLAEMFNVSKTCIKYHRNRRNETKFVKESDL
jgi:hypothetical protein